MSVRPEDLTIGHYYKLENMWVDCDILKYQNTNYSAALRTKGVYHPHKFTKELGVKPHLVSDAVLKRLEPCIRASELVPYKKYRKHIEGASEPVIFLGGAEQDKYCFTDCSYDVRYILTLMELYKCIEKDLNLNLYTADDLEVYQNYKHDKGYIIQYLCRQDTVLPKSHWESSFKPKGVEREENYLFTNCFSGEYEYLTSKEVGDLRKEYV